MKNIPCEIENMTPTEDCGALQKWHTLRKNTRRLSLPRTEPSDF